MPTFEGQLGTLLNLEIASILVSSRWSLSQAATGGEIQLVVLTAYVGDGCPFEFTILDQTGSKLATLKAKSVANVCRAKWTISDKAKGALMFIVEAPSVGLKGRSDALTVLGRLRVGPVEAFDDKGATLAKVAIGQKMRWKAKMPGVPDGTQAKWTIVCRQDKAHMVMVASGVAEVTNGEAVVDWETIYPMDQGDKAHQTDLDKTSETYEDATFQATFACLGVSDKSKNVPVKTEVAIRSNATGQRPVVSPDGAKKKLDLSRQESSSGIDHPIGSTVLDPTTFDEAK